LLLQAIVDMYAECDRGIAAVLYWSLGWFAFGVTPALIALKLDGE
jgi:hypothetical protein